MEEPTSLAIWILFWASGIFSIGMFGLVIYLLKTGDRKYIGTFSSEKTKIEDGPVLELPDGVVRSKE